MGWLDEQIEIPDGVNAGGKVYPRSERSVLVGDPELAGGERPVPWHQGREPDWQVDRYAEFVNVGTAEEPQWSRFLTDGLSAAHRVHVDIEVGTYNEHRFHDWKSYDEVQGRAFWRVRFNRRPVGSGSAWTWEDAQDAARAYARKLGAATVPVNWSDDDPLAGLVGRLIYYNDQPAAIVDVDQWDRGIDLTVEARTPSGAFRPPAWVIDSSLTDEHSADAIEMWQDDYGRMLRTSLLSDDIWWWRDLRIPGVDPPLLLTTCPCGRPLRAEGEGPAGWYEHADGSLSHDAGDGYPDAYGGTVPLGDVDVAGAIRRAGLDPVPPRRRDVEQAARITAEQVAEALRRMGVT